MKTANVFAIAKQSDDRIVDDELARVHVWHKGEFHL